MSRMSAAWSSAVRTAPTVSGPIAWPPSTSSTSSSTTARASATLLAVAVERQLVAAQGDRAAEPVAQRVEHAVGDAGELGRNLVGNDEHRLARGQCRSTTSRPATRASRPSRSRRGRRAFEPASHELSGAARALGSWPVTAAMNEVPSRASSSTAVRAVTVAVRGTLRSSAISPKQSPRPSEATCSPPTETSSSPSATM